jgi:Beta-propeller repeat
LTAYNGYILNPDSVIQNSCFRSVALDDSGNMYVTGESSVNSVGIVTKIDNAGTTQWAKLIYYSNNGGGSNAIYQIGEFVYVAMKISNVGTISGISGGFRQTDTLFDVAILKYSTAGVLQWATMIGAPIYFDIPNSITADSSGNVYTAGYTSSSGLTLSGALGGFTKTTSNADAFIVKHDSAGVLQWAKIISGSNGL